jgi:hypothetical protein
MTLIRGLNVPHETSIVVETRRGTRIPNYQSHEFSAFEMNQFHDIERDYPQVEFRTPLPNPIYNCHGLTFASRRTGIYDSGALDTILREDGYTEVDRNSVLPGDIILYFGDGGDIEHSGVIISEPDQQLHVPKVVSKWGRYKEAVHWANNCPYDFGRVRYYRVTK